MIGWQQKNDFFLSATRGLCALVRALTWSASPSIGLSVLRKSNLIRMGSTAYLDTESVVFPIALGALQETMNSVFVKVSVSQPLLPMEKEHRNTKRVCVCRCLFQGPRCVHSRSCSVAKAQMHTMLSITNCAKPPALILEEMQAKWVLLILFPRKLQGSVDSETRR